MASGDSILSQFDAQLDQLLAGWNIYSTVITLVLVALIAQFLFSRQDPDTHPLLLARQSSASHVRQPGESAVYRSLEAPHSYPLRSGLGVKEPGAPKWTSGRDGDLRDIWKQALRGVHGQDGQLTGEKGKFLKVLGREGVVEHHFEELTRDINIIGQHLRQQKGGRVAIYLPNSVEFLVAFFAAAFYGLTIILIPQGQSREALADFLRETNADILLAQAGTLSLDELMKSYSGLRHVIWVVEKSSRHMDWKEPSDYDHGRITLATWHNLIEEQKGFASSDPPSNVPDFVLPNILAVWQRQTTASLPEMHEVVEFTQKNIIAAVAAQIFVLPRLQRLGPSDLFLPLDSLSLMYPLTLALAALFSNASIALTSVAGPVATLSSAFQNVSPTVIVASAETLSQTHRDKPFAPKGAVQKIKQLFQARELASGTMPVSKGGMTHSLRLIYVSERVGADSMPLNSRQLFDLKLWTGARIVYALTAAKVAGAVAQTNACDYRRSAGDVYSHFGPPLSCLEVKLVGSRTREISDDGNPIGTIFVSGPAVIGGSATLDVEATITDDNTLAYI
ncbi:MAG: hypothetical protein FRX48_03294 [Lasallia pustulata]|uniref:AMP-dependent synthetase/ligase domain-containing protein n=1 Tax=Lasallia pustulata TaxID=136370 RepID=A0A5M8PV69_9LECA|nr:MAG: hypothetical protein FRX48_03294 [Lasallia pustulata]